MQGYECLGQGTFGCVIKPYIDEPKYHIRFDKNLDVSKVFSKEEHRDLEYHENSSFLSIIDTENKATVKMNAQNNITDPSQKNIVMNVCKKLTHVYQYHYPQIIFEDGGIDIDNFLSKQKTIDFNDFIKSIKEVCIVLSKLHSVNMIHRDIKPGNILIDENNKIRIIDFGLASQFKDVYIKGSLNVLNHPYTTFPPEFRLAGYILSNISTYDDLLILLNDKIKVKKIMKSNYGIHTNIDEWFNNIERSSNNFIDRQRDKFISNFIDSLESLKESLKDKKIEDINVEYIIPYLFNNLSHFADVYSLGTTMIYLINNINFKDDIQKQFIYELINYMTSCDIPGERFTMLKAVSFIDSYIKEYIDVNMVVEPNTDTDNMMNGGRIQPSNTVDILLKEVKEVNPTEKKLSLKKPPNGRPKAQSNPLPLRNAQSNPLPLQNAQSLPNNKKPIISIYEHNKNDITFIKFLIINRIINILYMKSKKTISSIKSLNIKYNFSSIKQKATSKATSLHTKPVFSIKNKPFGYHLLLTKLSKHKSL